VDKGPVVKGGQRVLGQVVKAPVVVRVKGGQRVLGQVVKRVVKDGQRVLGQVVKRVVKGGQRGRSDSEPMPQGCSPRILNNPCIIQGQCISIIHV
jgi:hypothetical protein